MKICWDNLEKLRYSKKGNRWYKGNTGFIYKDSCERCGEPFLTQNKKGRWCSNECYTLYSKTDECRKICSINGKKLKGHKRSEEYKRKMSIIKTPQNRGSNNPMYGKHHSEKSKALISKNKIGTRHTDEWKENMSVIMSGTGNPNWKGGISYEEYCPVWKDKEYKDEIKERDGYTCQNPLCWGKSKKLCIHHIDYNKKNCGPNNLITLCFSCNARANFKRKTWKVLYEKINNKEFCL